LKLTLDGAYRRAAAIVTNENRPSYSKRYLAQQWEKTCKAAGIVDLHFHDIRGTAVTMFAEAGCTLPEIVSITATPCGGRRTLAQGPPPEPASLRRARSAKFENVIAPDFAKRDCKMTTTKAGAPGVRTSGPRFVV
jgi:hypothetical protein